MFYSYWKTLKWVKWEPIFDKALGRKGIHINSALVSAQSRKRIYWTNINNGEIPLPKDRGLLLKDIIEESPNERYVLSNDMTAWLNKHANNRGSKIIILNKIVKHIVLLLHNTQLI